MWNLERYKENIALYLESGETISYQQIAQSQKEIGSVLRGRTVAVLVCRNMLSFFNAKRYCPASVTGQFGRTRSFANNTSLQSKIFMLL